MAERCGPCEAHAQIHGFFDNKPCAQCESHAAMHSEGCGGLFMTVLVTVAVSVLRSRNRA
ncbi:hypothetical protein [Streptomyces sp. NPDC046925]|uniref:hypothetical protein n=1 Tax=Streptomyces sp. NPDC046925 TaxID=3155375 RepID=UPI0033FF4470